MGAMALLALLRVWTAAHGDDTVLLDKLSAHGGLIQLEARTYHHVGDWVLSR